MKQEIKVTFKTITPLWTGDAWQENNEIKPSAIMGSLRFWFEIICFFSGIEVKEKEELNYEKYKNYIKTKFSNCVNIEDISFQAAKDQLTLPSLIFGCTRWKSRIRIKDIICENEEKYFYPIGKLEIENLQYEKEFFSKKDNTKKIKTIIPTWYFQKGFLGEITIIFLTSEEIAKNILLPLLKYIEEYFFIGGKNNIGYGRVKIEKIVIDGKEKNIDDFEFNNKVIVENNIFEKVDSNKIDTTKLNYNKIQILEESVKNTNLQNLIKKLLERKAEYRKKDTNKNIRHYKFGSIAKDTYENKKYNIKIEGPNGTKIIPLISKQDENYIGNFISIWGIQNFGVKNDK